MIRVLHLINSMQPGGIETWLLRMLRQLPRHEIAMDIACKGAGTGKLAPDAICAGAKVMHFPLRPTHVGFIASLRRALHEGGYDLVHNHLDVTGGPAVWAARRSAVPVISSFHNTHFAPQTWTRLPIARQFRGGYARVSIAYALRHSARITGCSQAVLDNILPDNRHDPRCRRLYYGVESHARASEAVRAAFRQSLGLASNAQLVLHVGRFFAQKNHEGLLRIFRQVAHRAPHAQLLLVGDGAERGLIESRIAEMKLASRVQLLGFRKDVPQIMTASDAMLFPSFHEGLPVVSLEASACGLPLIGSDIPGTNEAIVSGETGLLHDVTDEDGMAASVTRVLEDATLANRLREAAWQRVAEKFSTAASARSLAELYESTLQKATSTARQAPPLAA